MIFQTRPFFIFHTNILWTVRAVTVTVVSVQQFNGSYLFIWTLRFTVSFDKLSMDLSSVRFFLYNLCRTLGFKRARHSSGSLRSLRSVWRLHHGRNCSASGTDHVCWRCEERHTQTCKQLVRSGWCFTCLPDGCRNADYLFILCPSLCRFRSGVLLTSLSVGVPATTSQ